jgi:hypothetical protein
MIDIGGSVTAHESLGGLLTGIERLAPHPRNARMGDTDAIGESIRVNKVYRPLIVQRSSGYVLAGNHTYAALMEAGAEQAPVVFLDVDDEAALRIMLADNRTADLGRYDDGLMLELLRSMEQTDASLIGTGYDSDALRHLEFLTNQTLFGLERDAELEAGKAAPTRTRNIPIKLILSMTGANVAENLIAGRLGWHSGVISTHVQSWLRFMERFGSAKRLAFMDNPWHNYDHAAHVAALAAVKPESATVRDLVTREQAAEHGVPYYPISQTLEQAAEIAEHVDDVILIPKYDCLDELPERIGGARVVLGYSVISSYGGTMLPITAFGGRPIHLLGGPWNKQRAYLNLMGDDIISLDNNYIVILSKYGRFFRGDGSMVKIESVVSDLNAFYFPCLVLSMAEIATATQMDFGTPIIEEAHDDDDLPLPLTDREGFAVAIEADDQVTDRVTA